MAYTAQSIGQLAQLLDQVRVLANEPSISAKYPSDKLYPLLKSNYRELMNEILRLSIYPIVARYQFTVTEGTDVYMLPPNIGTIYRLTERDPDTDGVITEYYNVSRKTPGGPGFVFEGNVLRWIPSYKGSTVTLTLEYTPNGMTDLHLGVINPTGGAGTTSTTWKLNIAPTEGYFDKKPNAFLGSYLRLLTSSSNPASYTFFPEQQRIITGYSATPTPVVTVNAAWAPDISTMNDNITYEITPEGLDAVTPTLALRTALTLHRIAGNEKRVNLLLAEYRTKIRDIRLAVSQMDAIRGPRHEHESSLSISDLYGLI